MKMTRPRIESRIQSVLMPSAFGEPLDSGRKMPAKAVGASARGANTAMEITAATALRRVRVREAGGATGAEVYGGGGGEDPSCGRFARPLTVVALTGR